MFKLNLTGIRTRLLLVFVSILLLGFAGLTLVAGRQISGAAQADYVERLQNEMRLIAQGLSSTVDSYVEGNASDDELKQAFAPYESEVNGTLTLYPMQTPPQRGQYRDSLELETALRGQMIVIERRNEDGNSAYYTAAPIFHGGLLHALIQLRVPADNLQAIVMQRWLELVLVFAFVTGLALFAALWLSRSIIQPLYRLRESAVHLSKGDFSHRIAEVGKDEVGQVAQAFNEMADQVESMLEEQRAFASSASHELRTPLTTIRLRTEALRHDSSLDEGTARLYVEEIDDEAMRLGNLVQDLTLLSRFDAGRAALGQDEVEMQRFATSIQQQMTPAAEGKHIRIVIDAPTDPLVVHASLNHLTVVFRNVLDNAIKYTPEGGCITWTIGKEDQGMSSRIQDTGRGVPADHLPHLFERFYRADKARSRGIPGTGLGLALVKSVVEAYGGRIMIESQGRDQGTTVNITWPHHPVSRKISPLPEHPTHAG